MCVRCVCVCGVCEWCVVCVCVCVVCVCVCCVCVCMGCVSCAVCRCDSGVVCFAPDDDQENNRKQKQKTAQNSYLFSTNCVKMASRSVLERLLRHFEASQGLGRALETYGAQLAPAIQPQKSLLESRRVALGRSTDTFLKPGCVIFIEKRRQKRVSIDF